MSTTVCVVIVLAFVGLAALLNLWEKKRYAGKPWEYYSWANRRLVPRKKIAEWHPTTMDLRRQEYEQDQNKSVHLYYVPVWNMYPGDHGWVDPNHIRQYGGHLWIIESALVYPAEQPNHLKYVPLSITEEGISVVVGEMEIPEMTKEERKAASPSGGLTLSPKIFFEQWYHVARA